MTSETKKFDVLVVGAGHYDLSFIHHLRRGKSSFLNSLVKDDRFNVLFLTPEEVCERETQRKFDQFWFDEMTNFPVELPLDIPVKGKPKPYWRQNERW